MTALLLLACTGPAKDLPDETAVPADDTTLETDSPTDTDAPEGARDIFLVTEHSGSMEDDLATVKNQAPELLALLGEHDRLGVVTDGANGCAVSGILDRDSDPQVLRNSLNGQEGPLSGNLLEAAQRALWATEASCNTGLDRPGASTLVILLSDQSGITNDLSEIAVFEPVIWWLGESACTGAYAEAAAATGGQVVCPWTPDGLKTALTP
jgi:hypothetical protein